jgi:hypothetical protein
MPTWPGRGIGCQCLLTPKCAEVARRTYGHPGSRVVATVDDRRAQEPAIGVLVVCKQSDGASAFQLQHFAKPLADSDPHKEQVVDLGDFIRAVRAVVTDRNVRGDSLYYVARPGR